MESVVWSHIIETMLRSPDYRVHLVKSTLWGPCYEVHITEFTSLSPYYRDHAMKSISQSPHDEAPYYGIRVAFHVDYRIEKQSERLIDTGL